MPWNPEEPYNSLPLLSPAVELESKIILKAAIEARAQLAALEEACKRLPNPVVLINAIQVLEAQASSEIENIVTTTDDLFRYMDEEDSATPATKEALRYRAALFAGFRSLSTRPLTTTTAMEICSTIKQREMDIRDLAGTVITDSLSSVPVYTPPVGEQTIRNLLSDWTEFVHAQDELDYLVKMAVSHYQFEAIHPFSDGNGRTGRILNVLQLNQYGLLSEPILYLSRYIIDNKNEYYQRLLAVTQNAEWENWILFMLTGVAQTARGTLRQVNKISELQKLVRIEATEKLTNKLNSEMFNILFEQPYVRISNVVERCAVSRPTASKWLNELVENDILSDLKVGRERLFINSRYLKILTDRRGFDGSHG